MSRPPSVSRAEPTARRERRVLVALWMGSDFGRDAIERIAPFFRAVLRFRVRPVFAVGFGLAVSLIQSICGRRILHGLHVENAVVYEREGDHNPYGGSGYFKVSQRHSFSL